MGVARVKVHRLAGARTCARAGTQAGQGIALGGSSSCSPPRRGWPLSARRTRLPAPSLVPAMATYTISPRRAPRAVRPARNTVLLPPPPPAREAAKHCRRLTHISTPAPPTDLVPLMLSRTLVRGECSSTLRKQRQVSSDTLCMHLHDVSSRSTELRGRGQSYHTACKHRSTHALQKHT